jgi:hypothetical protein
MLAFLDHPSVTVVMLERMLSRVLLCAPCVLLDAMRWPRAVLVKNAQQVLIPERAVNLVPSVLLDVTVRMQAHLMLVLFAKWDTNSLLLDLLVVLLVLLVLSVRMSMEPHNVLYVDKALILVSVLLLSVPAAKLAPTLLVLAILSVRHVQLENTPLLSLKVPNVSIVILDPILLWEALFVRLVPLDRMQQVLDLVYVLLVKLEATNLIVAV